MQQKFAMNKTLEQKLIGPMEESHTKEQSPKAVLWEVLWARRSKITAKWARTRAWAGWWFFWEEGVCECRNKWRGATMGPRGRGCAQGGRARPLPSWPGGRSPRGNFCTVKFSNIPEKIILNWHGILRTFIIGIFLYCTNKSGNRQKNTILLYFY